MTEVKTDKRGRITIPKEIREKHGDSYRLIELKTGIKLIPIPEEPLKELKDSASRELQETPIKEIMEEAEKEAEEQALK